MRIFDKIKEKIGLMRIGYLVDHNHREKKLIPIDRVRSIGFVFELDNDEDYQAIHDQVSIYQKMQIEVKALGYVRNKHMARKFMPLLSFDFFFDKQLNWHFKPTGEVITDFMNKEFDILIDLNINRSIPLRFITASSVAKFIVGPYIEEDQKFFDLMINCEEEGEMKEYLKNIHHYLSILKPGNHAKEI